MIGRKDEIDYLDHLLSSKKPEFLALYGRRRVGKTYLIKEFFNDTFSFYSTGVQQSNTKQQLRAFKESLVKYGDQVKSIPKDWFEAFSRLENLLSEKGVIRDYRSGRRVIFLDELPWMDTPRSDFKSALEYFWNSWASSQKDLILIVCGSATSWIINNIVKNTGGFYNRITGQIHLMPFSLGECEQLLSSNGLSMTRKQIIISYMILGGIPYYLNYLRPGLSLAQNIDMLFFRENSPLRYEYDQLFSSLFTNADKYKSIIKELSKRKRGVLRTELDNKGTISGKELTRCLEDLEQSGFIRKYHDYSTPKNGCLFQLTDPLCLFSLTLLEPGKISSWMDFIETPAYYGWCGLAFERICMLHIPQIKKALGISGVSCQVYSWKSKKSDPGAQIDLLIERKDDVINLCEAKFTNDKYELDKEEYNKLQNRISVFQHETRTGKSVHTTMITVSGLKAGKYSDIVQSIITGDELFSL
ncbi:MAG: ATP-binding protein [Lachnospiraceae bacterium]|nr:ATP-binding protein [Lachnospiraceae bacterium]